MTERALSDVVVLELSTGVAGPYCGKLLADLGAQTIKVEPSGGDPLRAEDPVVNGESAFFAWMNGSKLGAVLNVADPRLRELAAHADIIIHDLCGNAADALDAGLKLANPAAVIVSLTPYGRSGPRSGWLGSPLTEWATSGYTYIAGDPAREPISLPGYQAEYHAGLHAASGALAALWHARRTGQGQVVEVSHQESCLSDHAWVTTMWSHQGKIQMRTGSIFAKCADGYIFLFNLVPYPNLFILMERFDMLEDEELLVPLNYMARFTTDVFPVFSEWAASRTKQEIYHACQELRIAASPVNTMEDLATSAQLMARDWLSDITVGGQTMKAPGFPYKLTGTPCEVSRPAPALGEHTSEVTSAGFAWTNAGVARGALPAGAEAPGLPLAGLRLIEVTANWAGPIGGRHLADLGADVIKIELASKPATRALVWIADDLWPDHWHRSAYFNKLNRNKRAICLDLSKPEGKRVFLELVKKADAVLENNAARVMGNLGLGYDTLSQANPKLVMCSMSGFGGSGPEKDYSAYGSNIETISGLASLLGYGPGEYFGTGTFYADPVSGNHGAVAMLAALHAAQRTGKGQSIDMALLEAAVPFFAQQFLHYTATGEIPEPRGNDAWGNLYEGLVPTAGRDCWLALTVRDSADVARLGSVVGGELDAPDRVAIDAAVRAWALTLDHIDAAGALQAAGIAAAPVMPNWEIVTDNHLNDRGFFVPTRHPRAGTISYPGFPWRLEKTPAALRHYAPLFAEHNGEVFRDLLGLSEDEIARLYADGVTRDTPDFAMGSL